MLHAGGRRLEEVRELKAEQEVLAHLGLKELPSRLAGMGDWLRRRGKRGGVAALPAVNRELIRNYLPAEPAEVTLDVDATILCAEKREAEWTYQKGKGYQPLLGYGNGVCVHHEFRAGNEGAGDGAVEFLEPCEEKLAAGKKV